MLLVLRPEIKLQSIGCSYRLTNPLLAVGAHLPAISLFLALSESMKCTTCHVIATGTERFIGLLCLHPHASSSRSKEERISFFKCVFVNMKVTTNQRLKSWGRERAGETLRQYSVKGMPQNSNLIFYHQPLMNNLKQKRSASFCYNAQLRILE